MPIKAQEIPLSPLAIEGEEWRPVEWTDGFYEVSSNGRVRRVLDRYGRPCQKVMRQQRGTIAYPTVYMTFNGQRRRVTVHRLVASAFIPNPGNLPQVNHKDENPCNNNVSNLEWCTETYNHNYGTVRERLKSLYENPIVFEGVRYRSIHDCARRTGHTRITISRRCERLGPIRWPTNDEQSIPVLFEGVAYPSIRDCARQSGADRRRIKKYSERINQ